MRKKNGPAPPSANEPLSEQNTFSEARWFWPLMLLACLAIGLVYSSTPDFAYTDWDDTEYISKNEQLGALNVDQLVTEVKRYVMGNYHPVTMLSYAAEIALGGKDPGLMHITNVLLHLLNTLLIGLFIRRLTGRALLAGLTALLWAVHPLRVESVAWLSARKDLLMLLFGLCMFISYLRWLDGKRWQWLVAAHLAFVLACASKAMAVAFVPCLLLMDQLKGRSLAAWRPWLEKSGFAVLAVVFGILALDAQQSVKTIGNVELDALQRLWVGGANLVVYMVQQFVPTGLNARYAYPLKNGHLPEWYPWAALLAMGLLFLLVRALRKPNLLVFAFGFMVLNLVLVLQWLPVGQAIRADRYTYAAGIGWSLAVALGLELLVRWSGKHKTVVWTTALLVMSAAFAWLAHQRAETWRTAVSVRTDMIADDPRYFVSYMDRAVSYEHAGDHEAALKDFDKAAKMRPASDFKPLFERGMFRMRRGAYREAMPDLIATFQQVPDHPGLVPSMIYIQWKLGLCHEVEPNATQALRLDPRSPDLLNLRGICRLQSGQPDSAWADAKRSIAVAPRKPETLVLAAAALSALHHEESACVALRIAGDAPILDTTLDSLRTVLSDRCPSITKFRERRQP